MESQLADFIQPDGWAPWSGNQFLDTLYYAEYGNTGPGAATKRRVRWKTLHFLRRNEALQFTAGTFLRGGQWIRNTGVPALLGPEKMREITYVYICLRTTTTIKAFSQ
ncbi:hypothetical protein NC653_004820 [Populus alba x Populus x berolinensis]|uniref:Pectinesterase catalytic domain-containing protein n=1 Tax=Populus alba x Populus x berolinensis TaxID=444605 RepID=A0AAD6RVJ5_9ROSI|nr:hypothetical protein NC653_004820 [Populus alba x Populus x berolinensis]